MDKIRSEFESWMMSPPYEHMCDRNSEKSAWPGEYKRYETWVAWDAWKAAHALYTKTEAKGILNE